MGTKIRDAALVVRSDRSTRATALADQEAAEWRDAFDTLGLDITSPEVAAGAFAMAQILLWHLTTACAAPESALQVIGKAITDGVIALAEFVR